jgi:hypothetical protein
MQAVDVPLLQRAGEHVYTAGTQDLRLNATNKIDLTFRAL